jgi:hypothetical protein
MLTVYVLLVLLINSSVALRLAPRLPSPSRYTRGCTARSHLRMSAGMPTSDTATSIAHCLHNVSSVAATTLSSESIRKWEVVVDSTIAHVRNITTTQELLSAYRTMLHKVAPLRLDPLQITSFEVISNAIADSLLQFFPKDTAITSLVEQITDVHNTIITEMFEHQSSTEEDNL